MSDDDQTPGIRLSRRGALVVGLAGGLYKLFDPRPVQAATDSFDIDILAGGEDNINLQDGQTVYIRGDAQQQDVAIHEFVFQNPSITFTVEDELTEEQSIFIDIAIQINGSDWELFGMFESEPKEEGFTGDVEAHGHDLFGDQDGWNPTDETFDLSSVDIIDSQTLQPLNLEFPTPDDPPSASLESVTDIDLRVRGYSENGNLFEREDIGFTLRASPKLGFGAMFGRNFGAEALNTWDDNWEDNLIA